jgi:hypothetical protein
MFPLKPDIWRFSPTSLLAWSSAYAIWEPISYYLIPQIFKAQTTRQYYDKNFFSFATVAGGDFIYSTMLFLIAQQVISVLFGSAGPATVIDWLKRLATFIAVQWAGDLTFWQIISRVPAKGNKYIDFFQRYGKDVGVGAPIGDSLYGIVWFTLTQLTASFAPAWLQVFLISTFLFLTLILSFN